MASKNILVRRATNRRFQRKRRDTLRKIKLTHGCKDCGYKTHPAALQFDHLRDKKFNIMENAHIKPWPIILEEVSKCEVVCSNCHAIRTYNRRQLLKEDYNG